MSLAMLNLFCSICGVCNGLSYPPSWKQYLSFWVSGVNFGVFAFGLMWSLVK